MQGMPESVFSLGLFHGCKQISLPVARVKEAKVNVLYIGNDPRGNHVPLVIALSEKLGIGVHNVKVYHDDWCSIFKPDGMCDCSPDVEAPRENMEQ